MSIVDNIKAIIKDNSVHDNDTRRMYMFVAGGAIGTYLGTSYGTLLEPIYQNCGSCYSKPKVVDIFNLKYKADKRTIIIECATIASIYINSLAYVLIFRPNITLFYKYQRLDDIVYQYTKTSPHKEYIQEKYGDYITSTKVHSISDVVEKISGVCCAISLCLQNTRAAVAFGSVSLTGYIVKLMCNLKRNQKKFLETII